MEALLYTRVSHDDQVKYGLSLDAQLNSLTKYCEENKIKVKKVYSDEGISGGTIEKRVAFNQMINESKSGDIILFTKLDRFSRNVLDANIIVKELDKKNVSIRAIQEDDVDTSTADGRFMFNLKLSLAEREREKVSERINDVFAYQVKNGYSISGTVPLGYKKVDKKYLIDEETASMIIELFNFYDTYQNLSKTVKWWNQKYPDYKTSYNNLKRYRLRNTIYIGVHPSGLNDTFCEPIVDKELFYRVQNKLNKNIKEHKRTKHVYYFSKLIRCSKCGNIMVGNFNTTSHYHVYRCNNAYMNGNCENRKILSENKVEAKLLDELKNMINDDNFEVKFSKKDANVKETKQNINNIKSKMERLKDLYIDGLIERDEFDQKYNDLKAEIDKLEKQIETPKEVLKTVNELKNINFDKMYNALSRTNKQAFWHRFIKEIGFDGKEISIVYY